MDEFGNFRDLTPDDLELILLSVISPMACNGLRTICVAYRYISAVTVPSLADLEDEGMLVPHLTCLAIFGVEDSVRAEVPKAIRCCQRAGVTVRMVTGDNLETARSVARKCGIVKDGDGCLIIDGEEFNQRIRDESGQVTWPSLYVFRGEEHRIFYCRFHSGR